MKYPPPHKNLSSTSRASRCLLLSVSLLAERHKGMDSPRALGPPRKSQEHPYPTPMRNGTHEFYPHNPVAYHPSQLPGEKNFQHEANLLAAAAKRTAELAAEAEAKHAAWNERSDFDTYQREKRAERMHGAEADTRKVVGKAHEFSSSDPEIDTVPSSQTVIEQAVPRTVQIASDPVKSEATTVESHPESSSSHQQTAFDSQNVNADTQQQSPDPSKSASKDPPPAPRPNLRRLPKVAKHRPDNARVFIGNLASEYTSADDIVSIFQQYGHLIEEPVLL